MSRLFIVTELYVFIIPVALRTRKRIEQLTNHLSDRVINVEQEILSLVTLFNI